LEAFLGSAGDGAGDHVSWLRSGSELLSKGVDLRTVGIAISEFRKACPLQSRGKAAERSEPGRGFLWKSLMFEHPLLSKAGALSFLPLLRKGRIPKSCHY